MSFTDFIGDTVVPAIGDLSNFLGGDFGTSLLQGAGNYYLGQENIQDVRDIGNMSEQRLTELGRQASEQAEFRPFTVTTGLSNVTTDPTGGTSLNLSPEQQALQNQIFNQASGLLNRAGVSPTNAQADIYEQIRATQRPEEERQRLAMEERLLSQGRLGLQSAAYGGSSPELLAMETARQEAMNRANLTARGQALAEQQQALAGAQGLLTAGYRPQQEALNALRVGAGIGGMAQTGQLTGLELQNQLERSGLEAQIGMTELASRLAQERDLGLMNTLLGRQPTVQEQIMASYAGIDPEELIQQSLLSSGMDYLGGLFSNIFNPMPQTEEEYIDDAASGLYGDPNEYGNIA